MKHLCMMGLLAGLLALPVTGMTFTDACGPDITRFCSETKAKGESVVRCLESRGSELSDMCKARLRRRGPSVDETSFDRRMGDRPTRRSTLATRRACAADARKLCSAVRGNWNRTFACLQERAEAVSPTCREKLN